MIACLPSTEPIRFSTSVRSSLPMRRFSMMASGASTISAKLRARLVLPRSGETTTGVEQALLREVARRQRHRAHLVDRDIEEALDLPGVQIDRQHPVRPGDADQLATSRAVIGTRGWSFLSVRP